jgi:hypothetical protein
MVNVDPLMVVEKVDLRCFGTRFKERLLWFIRAFLSDGSKHRFLSRAGSGDLVPPLNENTAFRRSGGIAVTLSLGNSTYNRKGLNVE